MNRRRPDGEQRRPDGEPGPVSLADLFLTFSRLALCGFGGVLPWAERVLVDERRWLTREQFLELLTFGQLMPGPNVCNVALMAGDRWFGWRGALVAFAGMLIAPGAVVMGIAVIYDRFAAISWVAGAISGMAAVAAGMLLATGIQLARAQPGRWQWLGFALAAFVGVGLLRLPLVGVLAALAPVAVLTAWFAERR